MTEVEQPSQNGIDTAGEDDANKARPADIEADMREMERRKRVEAIMCSKLFREELERIVDSQIREGGPSGILQHLSDLVGVPAARVGSVFKTSNCVLPINDIRGVESMGYAKGERILRCKLAATFRLLDLYGWTQGLGAQITARLNADQELFLVNPFGLLFHEVTASSLNKVDMQGNIVEHGTTNFGININHYILHSVVHAARPDIRCAIYIGCNPVVAVSSLKVGLLPLTSDAAVLGEIATHPYTGSLNEPEEREKLIRSLGPISKVLLLNNHGALCCGETIEEAFYAAYHIVQACETQLKVLPVGLDNLNLIPEEARKALYDASRKPPDGYEHKTSTDNQQQDNRERPLHSKPKWRVGGVEFEALMRMLDNAGFRTGYTYRNALVKSELPKPKNDVEVPPAVSSLGYLLEEEELYRQGIWKKSDLRKGGDRTRWLNSPNVYQRVEVLETGTPDPKKITKWVADGSPTHSTAVKIDNAMQFVPPGTNPKEFKRLQQQIKDNRRADKISAGPQSHILEGVTWDEANRIKDATVSATGDHVVLMGAASKGIIQRGYQHNATVYKAPYAKNPFDSVTDDDLNEYKKTVERKHAHGEYTDTDFSESEALSSLQTSGAQQKSPVKHAPSQSETEDASEPQVLRIETKQAPKPSQPEVVLSDATNDFLNVERMHTTTSKKPPTGRAVSHNIQENLVSDEFKNPSDIYYANFDPSLLRTKLNAFKNDFFNDPLNNLNCEYSNSSDSLKILNSYPTLDWSNLDFKTLEELHLDFRFHRDNSDSNKFLNPYICKFSGINREDKQDRNSFMVFDENHSFRSNEWISFNNSNTTYVCGTQSRGEHTPYRTSSQFTFNYPRYIQPDHKHIPLCPSKFVPCKQYHSYHEIFSSHRFINSPDDDFSNILKRKAKDSVIRFLSKVENPSKRLKLANVLETDAMDIDETEGLIVNPDWLNQRSIGSNLDTIIEEDERSMGGADKNERNCTPGFYEKIKNINYSNVSPNLEFNNTKTVSSDISLIPVVEQSTAEKDAIVDEINSFMNNLTLEEKEDEIHIDNVENSGEISGRSLMSRKQREMRKEEFYDLWNDHIAYYSCRDSMDSTVHDIENSNSSNDDNYETRSEITISSPSPFELDHSSGVSVDYFNGHFGYNIGKSESNSSRQGLFNNMFLASELSDSGETKDDFLSYESFKSDLISLSSNKNFSNMEINSDIEIIPSENLDHTKNLSEIDDNDELNSMEKLILEKITTSKDINREEKIIQKIETTIRNKVTPSKLEKKINEEISGMSPQQLNSTLNTIKSNSSSKSSNSKNILNTTASTNDSVVMKTSRQSISFSNSSSEKDKKKKACGCEPKRKLPLCPSLLRTKKINKVQKPSNTSATRPAIKNQKNKDNIAVDVKITKPENKKSNLKKKRNFISENILNVSSKQRRLNQNVGAIFSLNPFTTAPNGASTKVQVEFRKKLTSNVDNAVYSFETGKSTSGSPSFWVTMSPGSNVKKTKTFTLKKKQSSGTTKSSRTQKPPTFNMSNGKRKRNSRDKVARSNKESGSPMEGIKCIDDEIRELGQATNRLDKHTESCERKIDEFGKQITKMSRDFDDIVEFHQNIENTRLENEREMLASAVALNYSLSAEED